MALFELIQTFGELEILEIADSLEFVTLWRIAGVQSNDLLGKIVCLDFIL